LTNSTCFEQKGDRTALVRAVEFILAIHLFVQTGGCKFGQDSADLRERGVGKHWKGVLGLGSAEYDIGTVGWTRLVREYELA